MPWWPTVSKGVLKKKYGQQIDKGDPSPLLCPGDATSGILCPVLSYLLQKKERDLLERVQWRATKTLKGLEHRSYEEGLSDLGLFSLEKRRLRGDLINVYKYLRCGRQRDEARLFSVVCSDRTRTYGRKLECRKFHTNMQRNFFTVSVT